MNQHLGMPAVPVVQKGDMVKVGQLILSRWFCLGSDTRLCQRHGLRRGPLSGLPGEKVLTVVIDTSGDDWLESIDRSSEINTKLRIHRRKYSKDIRSRHCGPGRGGFFHSCEINASEGMKAEYLILNGAECEPYLTSDYRLMIEHGQEILIGGELMRRVLGDVRGIIGIEENKPRAIELMRKHAAHFLQWEVVPLKKRYPQGGEKQLIDAVLGRKVPSFSLPVSTGAVVQNVGTAYAVYEAVQKNKPLISNVLTVTSSDPSIQRNYHFRTGTPVREFLNAAGAPEQDGTLRFAKVVNGGPMMGKAVANLDGAVMKSTSGLLLFTEKETKRQEPGECIRCSKCFQACPMRLQPYLLYQLALAGRTEALEEHRVFDCIECGCCLYSCPAHLPLLDQIRLARNVSLKNKRKK